MVFIPQSLQKRIFSAAIMIPAVLLILYLGVWAVILLITVLMLIALMEWVQLSLKCTCHSRIVFVMAGIPYVVLSFVCCYFIYRYLGVYVSAWFLVMVWGSDIGAFVAGKTFGGPKMAPVISPNKTWAGFAGALLSSGVLAILGYFALVYFETNFYFEWMFVPVMFVAGMGLGAVCQVGDLMVSSLKRRAGAKDTGHIIPGHGGLLDRIDSMLLAAPVFLMFMVLSIPNGF